MGSKRQAASDGAQMQLLLVGERQRAEDTVRKLWRAVEQSADLVMITDREGLIEYVNPAFEALTGYLPENCPARLPES